MKSIPVFVTLDGTKEPLSEAQHADKLPDADADFLRRALQAFVKGRILRFSEATQRYEIAHDALAKQIHAKRSDEEIAILEVQRLVKSQAAMADEARAFFTEKQLLFMEPYLAKFNPSAAENDWIARSREEVLAQKEAAALRQAEELENARTRAIEAERLTNAAEQGRKRARTFSYLAGTVAAVAIGVGVYAFFQKQKADDATKSAQTESEKAKTNLQRMEVANAARLKTEIGKYITASERMRKLGDKDMAKAILLEASKLDSLKQNPAVDSLLNLLK